MVDDARPVHGQAVVEVAESLGLAPDDRADGGLGGHHPKDPPIGIERVDLEDELGILDLGEWPHLARFGCLVTTGRARPSDKERSQHEEESADRSGHRVDHGESV